jgi:hypothetical protein
MPPRECYTKTVGESKAKSKTPGVSAAADDTWGTRRGHPSTVTTTGTDDKGMKTTSTSVYDKH